MQKAEHTMQRRPDYPAWTAATAWKAATIPSYGESTFKYISRNVLQDVNSKTFRAGGPGRLPQPPPLSPQAAVPEAPQGRAPPEAPLPEFAKGARSERAPCPGQPANRAEEQAQAPQGPARSQRRPAP